MTRAPLELLEAGCEGIDGALLSLLQWGLLVRRTIYVVAALRGGAHDFGITGRGLSISFTFSVSVPPE